jgi:hypothetical protein
MQFDLGIVGLGLLLVISLGFGVAAQLVVGTGRTRRMWLIGATAWFLGGLYFSEVLFAWATIDDIQPIVDGLAFDEALLGGLLVGIPVVIVAWYLTRPGRGHRTTPA